MIYYIGYHYFMEGNLQKAEECKKKAKEMAEKEGIFSKEGIESIYNLYWFAQTKQPCKQKHYK